MAKYLIAGGVLALLLGGIAYSRMGVSDSDAPPMPQTSFSHSHGLAVDAEDPGKLYIATHEGLYVLLNEKELYRVGSMRDDLMGFTAHPTRGGTFLSSGHPARGGNIGFQKTEDGGLMWEKISDGINGPVDFHAMTVSRANPDIVYGFFRRLQRSLDGGKSWEMAKGAIQPFSLSTDPVRDTIVYAATENGVQISGDRGDTWKSLSSQLEGGAVSAFFLYPDGEALVFSERLEGAGRSTDGGASWERLEERFDGGVVLYFAHSAKSGVTYALTDQNAIYKSTNEGATWTKIR